MNQRSRHLRSNRVVMAGAIIGGVCFGLVLLIVGLALYGSGRSAQASQDNVFEFSSTLDGARASVPSARSSPGTQALRQPSEDSGLRLPSFPGRDFPVLGRLFGSGDEESQQTEADTAVTQSAPESPEAVSVGNVSPNGEPAVVSNPSSQTGQTSSGESSGPSPLVIVGPDGRPLDFGSTVTETVGSSQPNSLTIVGPDGRPLDLGGTVLETSESGGSSPLTIVGPDGRPLDFGGATFEVAEGSPFSSFGGDLSFESDEGSPFSSFDSPVGGGGGSQTPISGTFTGNSITVTVAEDGTVTITTAPPPGGISSGNSDSTDGGFVFSSFSPGTGSVVSSEPPVSVEVSNFAPAVGFEVPSTSQLTEPIGRIAGFPEAVFMGVASRVLGDAMFGDSSFLGSDDLKSQIRSFMTSEWSEVSLAGAEVFAIGDDGDVLSFYREEFGGSSWMLFADIGGFLMYVNEGKTLVVSELRVDQMQSLGADSDGFALLLFES